jgi:hypothetical protein
MFLQLYTSIVSMATLFLILVIIFSDGSSDEENPWEIMRWLCYCIIFGITGAVFSWKNNDVLLPLLMAVGYAGTTLFASRCLRHQIIRDFFIRRDRKREENQ